MDSATADSRYSTTHWLRLQHRSRLRFAHPGACESRPERSFLSSMSRCCSCARNGASSTDCSGNARFRFGCQESDTGAPNLAGCHRASARPPESSSPPALNLVTSALPFAIRHLCRPSHYVGAHQMDGADIVVPLLMGRSISIGDDARFIKGANGSRIHGTRFGFVRRSTRRLSWLLSTGAPN